MYRVLASIPWPGSRPPGIAAAIIGLLLLSACAQQPGPAARDEATLEPVDVASSPVPVVPPESRRPAETPRDSRSLLPPPDVAIVLSGRQPAYESVANELAQQLERYTIYDLSDASQPAEPAFRQINDSDAGAVVAIGLPAAKAAVKLSARPVVFSQVFNFREHGLVTDRSRGVAALPPLDAHLEAWTDFEPSLRRIGAIIGTGHDDLEEEARAAAEQYGLEIIMLVAQSDQEAQYEFRRLVPEIDGFWLFPDNRILSARSLQEMLALANRRKVSVAVSSEAMLDLGATISIAPVAGNIASTIVHVLREIESGRIGELPDVTPLSATRVVSN